MSTVEILLVTLVVLVAVGLLMLVGILIQVRRAARRLNEFVERSERDLLPLAGELRQSAAQLNRLASGAEQGLSKAEPLFASLGEAGRAVQNFSSNIEADLERLRADAQGLMGGLRMAGRAVSRQFERTGDDV